MSDNPHFMDVAIQNSRLRSDAEIAELVRVWVSSLEGIAGCEPYDPLLAAQAAVQITLELIARLSPAGSSGPCQPFADLFGAMVEVQSGATPLLFRPAKPSRHRHPDAPKLIVGKALAAAAVTTLLGAGCGLDKAAQWVAKHLQKGGAPFTRTKNAARTIKLWREKAADEKSQEPLCEAYREMLRTIEDRRGRASGKSTEDVLKLLLDDGLARGLFGTACK